MYTEKRETKKRLLTYANAISEAHVQTMRNDPDCFIMGLGVTDYKGIFGTTISAFKRFGPKRVIETPASENALTGITIGASLTGKRPVLIHARNDFMFLALDQMINGASKWKYMYGGKSSVSFVIRGIIGKGWGQGPTHSQSIQSVFMHFPGLYIAMPSTPYDAKGFIVSSLSENVPCVIIEHRRLYDTFGDVPKKIYKSKFGKARVIKKGSDITLVATSIMAMEGVKAYIALKKMGISLEVIDPRSLRPLDKDTILRSVRKTGRLIVADTSWTTCGFSSEVAALASGETFKYLKSPIKRIGVADCPSPVSFKLEEKFYPTYKDIFIECCKMLNKTPDLGLIADPIIDSFKGPY
ncbi:MAG: alpha-ketoacid dehydrogenase subunit beta [Candidatus Omnitrophica bacterium]|nr:alpha-ketoacid dehydrogenase subunit beta [Candidatus Omnitrophota bacterium]